MCCASIPGEADVAVLGVHDDYWDESNNQAGRPRLGFDQSLELVESHAVIATQPNSGHSTGFSAHVRLRHTTLQRGKSTLNLAGPFGP